MESDTLVSREKVGVRHSCMCDDQSIEGVSSPAFLAASLDDFRERKRAEVEAYQPMQFAVNRETTLSDSADLSKVLDLEENHRRDDELSLPENFLRHSRKALECSGVGPHSDVRIKIRQGCHSPDQST